jgi:hypothetical protein
LKPSNEVNAHAKFEDTETGPAELSVVQRGPLAMPNMWGMDARQCMRRLGWVLKP